MNTTQAIHDHKILYNCFMYFWGFLFLDVCVVFYVHGCSACMYLCRLQSGSVQSCWRWGVIVMNGLGHLVGVRNRTQVLCEDNQCSYLPSHLTSCLVYFTDHKPLINSTRTSSFFYYSYSKLSCSKTCV